MKIPIQGSSEDFDLDSFLNDQGLELQGTDAKYWENVVKDRGNVTFKVRNRETGEESDFDAMRFLEDNGYRPDKEALFAQQQETVKRQKDVAEFEQDQTLRKELDDAGVWDYLGRTVTPYTRRLMQSGKLSEGPIPSFGDIGRTSLAVGFDALSLIPRGAIGAFSNLKKSITGKGEDLDVSMSKVANYGADKVEDAGSNTEREETLSEHWEAIQEAFRLDPKGVATDIAKESLRDPMTGAAFIATASSGGALSPALAARAAPLMARLASKYKTVAAAGKVVNKPAQLLLRAQEKLQAASGTTKLAAGILEEGVTGGLQGVIGNYAMGEDQDAWNTFVIEGVEEGAFGAAMAPVVPAWNYLAKEAQIALLNRMRAEARGEPSAPLAELDTDAQALPGGAPAAPALPGGPPSATPLPAPQQSDWVDAEFRDVPPSPSPATAASQALPSPVPPPSMAQGATTPLPVGTPSPQTPLALPPGRTWEVNLDGSGIRTTQGTVASTDALPPGISRHEVMKKLKNPAYQTAEDKEAARAQAEKREKIRSDIKALAKQTRKVEEAATAEVQNAIEAARKEMQAEEKAALEARRKATEELQKDVEQVLDPTRETPFPVWNRLYGAQHADLEDKQNAFEDFHVAEVKRIQAIRERINPTEKKAGEKPRTQGAASETTPQPSPNETGEGGGEGAVTGAASATPRVMPMAANAAGDAGRGLAAAPDAEAPLLSSTPPARGAEGSAPSNSPISDNNPNMDASTSPAPVPQVTPEGTIVPGDTRDATETQSANPRDGGGAQPNDRGDGNAPRPGESQPGGNRAGGAPESNDRLQRPVQPPVAREPGDARPVETKNPPELTPAQAGAKEEEDFERGSSARPMAPSLYDNIDLRGRKPIVLTKGQRIQFNQQSKAIVERWIKDPSSLTVEDRETLRHYTGQGGLGAKADEDAMEGILNQHYTSYPVIDFAWQLIKKSGFPLGRRVYALEPSAGIGNFIGFKPDNVVFYANEVDETSSKILQILYPRNVVNRQGPFESWIGPKMDIVISNVPFFKDRGAYEHMETDSRYKGIKGLHNYFLMKGIDQLTDNGLGLFITSTGTMDAKTGMEFRKAFNLKAEILGAFRLPSGSFEKNTGYAGATDLIVVRKRTAGEMATSAEDRLQMEWVDTIEVEAKSPYGATAKAYRSRWYEAHPAMVMGDFYYGEARGLTQAQVRLRQAPGQDFEMALQQAFIEALKLMENSYIPAAGAEMDPALSGYGPSIGRAKEETPVFGLEVREGKVYRKDRQGELRPFRSPTQTTTNKAGETSEKPWDVPEDRFALLVDLMAQAEILRRQSAFGEEVKPIQESIKTLLDMWQKMPGYPRQPVIQDGVARGPALPGVTVSRRRVQTAPGVFKYRPEIKFGDKALEAHVAQDRRWNLIRSLYDKKLTGYSRALTHAPELKAPPAVEKGNMQSARGVVEYLLKKFGVFRHDVARAEFVGSDEDFHREMMAHPDLNWNGETFEHDHQFIQGNLREKIAYAKKMGLTRQARKLEAALPEQKTPQNVPATPFATWWSPEALTGFARSRGILGQGYSIARIRYGLSERFRVLDNYKAPVDSIREEELAEFVENVLNQRPIKVPDPSGAKKENGDPIMVPDHKLSKETKKKWTEQFDAWVRSTGISHAVKAAERFNRDYASNAQAKEQEGLLHIAGISPMLDGRPIKFYPSQMAVVRRGLRLFGYINAHGVGHGKTLGAILTFQALRNEGRLKRAIFVVPSKNRGMWRSNFVQVIPGVQVKIISSEGPARRLDLVDAANNDYDVILMSYDTFKTIPLGKSEEFISQDLALYKQELERMMGEENVQKGKASWLRDGQIKRLQEKIAKLENKLATIAEAMKDPMGVTTFEDLKSDAMWLDEAHTVKNSFEQMNEFADRSFLNSQSDSHVGNDMVYKTRYLHERNGRGGVFLLTATPTPNNPLEIYKIIKLVAPWEWTTRGINTMDDFVRNYVRIGPINAPGIDAVAGRQKEGVEGWENLKALREVVNTHMDFRKDNVDVKKPDVEVKPEKVELNDRQLNLMAEILVQAELSPKEMRKQGINMLALTGRAKALAVDPGLVDARVLDDIPNVMDRAPKIKRVMEMVEKTYQEDPSGNQLIFLDQFRIRDYTLLKNAQGQPVRWPKGFGYAKVYDADNNLSEPPDPPWLSNMTDEHRARMLPLLQDNRGDYSSWDPALFDKSGKPVEFSASEEDRYRPIIDEEGNVFVAQDGVRENLHDSMRRYAIDKIGMDPARVIVVNGDENYSPEAKTRLENLVADGLVSLIIGNTPHLGEGLNLQNRGRAIYHLDVPWTPKELEQRNGRMWRPRTEEDPTPLRIHNFIAIGSMDAKGYTIIDQKAEWQKDLFLGQMDSMDNAINNVEQTGFSYKDFAEGASVSAEYVAGYRMAAAINRDQDSVKSAQKTFDVLARGLETQKNLYAEAQRKIEDAQKRIKEGFARVEEETRKAKEFNLTAPPDKQRKIPEPYDPEHWQKVIANNQATVERGPQMIEEAQNRLLPYEKTLFDAEVVRRAQVFVKEVRANKWRTLGASLVTTGKSISLGFTSENTEGYMAFLQSVMPDIFTKYPILADMIAAKALKKMPTTEEMPEAAKKLLAWMRKVDVNGPGGQAGFSNPKVLGVIAGGTVFGAAFGPAGLGAYGLGLGLWWGFRRAQKAEAAKVALWSLRARLREMPGFVRLEPLIERYHLQSTRQIGRDFYTYEEAAKDLSPEERARIPGIIEKGTEGADPKLVAAARKLQGIFRRVAEEARKAGLDIETDLNYYPRMVDFEMLQKMKDDPSLMQENVDHLVKNAGFEPEEAYAYLMAYFDNSEDMRMERNSKRREELIKWIVENFPKISHGDFAKLYMKIQNRFGARIIGNLKYGRVAPMLLEKMYHRDPVYVMSRYIPGVWRSIEQRREFGENNARINDFIDANFPLFGAQESDARKEAKSWFLAELGEGRFASSVKDVVQGAQGLAWQTAHKLTGFQFWTKLGTSPISPARNVAYAFNMAFPLAGVGATLKGLMKALSETAQKTGYKRARIAGAVSDRLILDAYDLARNGENNTFVYMKDSLKYKWHPFTITEKFNRAFAFRAGIYYAQRLFNQAKNGGDAVAQKLLSDYLGADLLSACYDAGALSREAEDQIGLMMAERINGTTRAFDLPKWMNTPEGSVAYQFRRLAFRQTVVWRDMVIKPMTKGDYGPFVRWATAAGITTPLIAALAASMPMALAMLMGSDPTEYEEKEKSIPLQLLEWVNIMNLLGLYGDIAAGMDSGDDFGEVPLVGTFVGPTASTALHTLKDVGYDFLLKGESPGKQVNQVLRREVPFVNFLIKTGVFGENKGPFEDQE